jgi:hypothetical protein
MTNPFQYLLRRSHRATSLLYFRRNHAKVLSTFQRPTTGLLGDLPLGGFRFGHDRRMKLKASQIQTIFKGG